MIFFDRKMLCKLFMYGMGCGMCRPAKVQPKKSSKGNVQGK